jgi:hypothetical protein
MNYLKMALMCLTMLLSCGTDTTQSITPESTIGAAEPRYIPVFPIKSSMKVKYVEYDVCGSVSFQIFCDTQGGTGFFEAFDRCKVYGKIAMSEEQNSLLCGFEPFEQPREDIWDFEFPKPDPLPL